MKTRRKSYQEKSPLQRQRKEKIGGNSTSRKNVSTSTPSTIETNLTEIYENVKSVPNFTSKIQDFLRKNQTSSVHKQVRKKFPRRRIICYYPYDIIMSDLIDYNHSKMPYANGGYKYIMVFVDCFSKKAWAEPLKKKDGLLEP